MPSEARLAEEQAALVAALADGQASLPGFDATRLRAMSVLLRAKRRRAVARRCPGVAHALGESFAASFDEYAIGMPLRPGQGPMGDAGHFLQWLRDRGQLPRELRLFALKLRVLARMGFR